MTSHSEYAVRAREMDWSALRRLWLAVKAGHTPGWPPGKAFEYLVLRAFELDGAEVRWPFTVSMADETVEQIDGAVYAAHLSCLVEVKDTSSPVDVSVLAKVRSQLARRPAGTVGLVVSRSGFTSPAATLAGFFAPQTVLLVSGTELEMALGSQTLVSMLMRKYRECVELGAPQTTMLRSFVR